MGVDRHIVWCAEEEIGIARTLEVDGVHAHDGLVRGISAHGETDYCKGDYLEGENVTLTNFIAVNQWKLPKQAIEAVV